MSQQPATTIIRPDEKPWFPLPRVEGALDPFRLVEQGDLAGALSHLGLA